MKSKNLVFVLAIGFLLSGNVLADTNNYTVTVNSLNKDVKLVCTTPPTNNCVVNGDKLSFTINNTNPSEFNNQLDIGLQYKPKENDKNYLHLILDAIKSNKSCRNQPFDISLDYRIIKNGNYINLDGYKSKFAYIDSPQETQSIINCYSYKFGH